MTVEWEAETYRRLLMVMGGADGKEFARAAALLSEFRHFFPDAKEKWDSYCASMGISI